MSTRGRLTRMFLWLSVIVCGIGLGAKIFDVLVLVGAWGAAPPDSLTLMPYSSRFPIGPGNIFRPLSAILLVGILGALISGWKTPFAYRVWLWLPVVMLTVIWIFTPIVFWPMRDVLYEAGQGSIVISTAELVRLVRRWVLFDWLQIVGIAVAFVSSVQAISVPFPGARN